MSAAEPIGVVDAIAAKRAMVLNAARAGGMSETEMRRRMGLPPLPFGVVLVNPDEPPINSDAPAPIVAPPERAARVTLLRRRNIEPPKGSPWAGAPVPRDLGRLVATTAAAAWGVDDAAIFGDHRGQLFSLPRRQVIAVIVAQGYSYASVGRWIGKDHTTVIHAMRRHHAVLAAAGSGAGVSKQITVALCRDYAARWAVVVDALRVMGVAVVHKHCASIHGEGA